MRTVNSVVLPEVLKENGTAWLWGMGEWQMEEIKMHLNGRDVYCWYQASFWLTNSP
jgi:hypothetical protein